MKGSAPLPDLKRQAAFGCEGDSGVESGWIFADVLGAETAQQHGQSKRVLDLAHGAADARAFTGADKLLRWKAIAMRRWSRTPG